MKVTDVTTDAKFPKFSVVGKNGKKVTITDYGNSWQLKYPNSQRVYFDEYQQVIEYLEKKGY